MLKKLCIISHSGGLDSSTLIAKAIALGYTVKPINFNYGQKNVIEINAQKLVYGHFKKMYGDRILEPLVLDFNDFMKPYLDSFKDLRDSGSIEDSTELEYYMPFRNMVFTSICSMIGELICISSKEYSELAIGIGVHKHSEAAYKKDYWDITPMFIEKINEVVKLNDALNVSIFAPYADKFKEDIIKDAVELDVPYHLTWTCYNPKYQNIVNEIITVTPCGVCEACIERELQGQKAGVDDINDYFVDLEFEQKGVNFDASFENVNHNVIFKALTSWAK